MAIPAKTGIIFVCRMLLIRCYESKNLYGVKTHSIAISSFVPHALLITQFHKNMQQEKTACMLVPDALRGNEIQDHVNKRSTQKLSG